MTRTLALVCLLAASAPAHAGSWGGKTYPLERETCDTLAESQALLRTMAADHHAAVLFFDGAPARKLISAINPPGSKIVMQGDHVGLVQEPGLNSGAVYVADNPCGGFGTAFPMRLPDLRAALVAAQR